MGLSSSRHSFSTTRPEPQTADSLTQIGTREVFEFEHDQYRQMCRNFYEEHVKPFHDQWEKDQMVPRELWKAAGDAGMLCVTVPEEYGGLGLDVLYAAVNWEEQSYANTTGPGWFLHSEIVAPYPDPRRPMWISCDPLWTASGQGLVHVCAGTSSITAQRSRSTSTCRGCAPATSSAPSR